MQTVLPLGFARPILGESMFLRSVTALLLFSISPAIAATPSALPHVKADIRIDGVLDDHAWANALQVELAYETDPGENTRAPVKTIARLLEDGNSVYIGIVAYDPDPSRIRAWLRDRDSLDSHDYV